MSCGMLKADEMAFRAFLQWLGQQLVRRGEQFIRQLNEESEKQFNLEQYSN